ncbi:hypothetical protein CsSME_00052084 [Camellia sinensis var. sinensis]
MRKKNKQTNNGRDLELSSANDSGGVVTAFYLKSEDSELDFEFLGNRKEKPIRVQTNVFLKGKGSREQRIHI